MNSNTMETNTAIRGDSLTVPMDRDGFAALQWGGGFRKPRVLIVDDAELNREILSSMLEDSFEILQAENGNQAIHVLEQEGYDLSLMLLDLMMPEKNGYEVLTYMQQQRWQEALPVIVISAETDPSYITKAYEMGAVDYISRPFDIQIVQRRVRNTVELYLKHKRMAAIVAQQIMEKTSSYDRMLSILSHVVEFRNQESGLHVVHISYITEMLLEWLKKNAPQYGLTSEDVHRISIASSLHDIGKISIPDHILNKPGRLTPEEFAVMKTHSAEGAAILNQLDGYESDPLIRSAWEICRWHHERYDGRGYPDGLMGDQIPISAQAVSVADVYDALTSERCYKKAFTHEKAMEMILNGECGTFNPLLLECLGQIGDRLPEKLREDPAKLRQDREIARLTEEMARHRDLSVSNILLYRLQFENERANFFEKVTSAYTFTYRSESDTLTLSPQSAALLGMGQVIRNPGTDPALAAATARISLDWGGLQALAGADTPDCGLEVTLDLDGVETPCRCSIHAVWSSDENPRLLGAVGAVTLP